jgi:hypothetical protein
MRKIFTVLTVLALLAIPVSAMAVKAGDWELVGYTKLEAYWDSAQVNKNLSGPIARSNAAQPQNMGRVRFTAQSSRFGLKVNGPEVLGAKTQGYIEIDFDSAQDPLLNASNSYVPRMRHAWFRMDWPGGWQLLMGQYWGMFCDFYPETVNDGPYQSHGQATQRIPQVRLTYKTGPWTFAGLAGVAYDTNNDNATFSTGNFVNPLFGNIQGLVGSNTASTVGNFLGQRATFPQFHGQVIYEKDLYGKAAFANRPRGFVCDISAGVQRTQYMNGAFAGQATMGQGNFQAIGGGSNLFGGGGTLVQKKTQTLTPWVVQGTLFIPILVTKTDNLANTASVTIQGQIGQGFSFFGNGADADNSYFRYDSPGFVGLPGINTPVVPVGNVGPGVNYFMVVNYNRKLTPKYGGYIQGQYYFTNEWYCSVVYGFDKTYGVNTQDRNFAINPTGRIGGPGSMDVNNLQSYTYATQQDQSKFTGELQANLFWTPNKNLKFGMGYSWLRTTYFQQVTNGRVQSNAGTNHSVRFGGWFFF